MQDVYRHSVVVAIESVYHCAQDFLVSSCHCPTVSFLFCEGVAKMGIRYRKKVPDPANTSSTTKARETKEAKRKGGRPRKKVQAQRPPDARGAAKSKDDDKEGPDSKVPVADALHAALKNEVSLERTLAITMKGAKDDRDSRGSMSHINNELFNNVFRKWEFT